MNSLCLKRVKLANVFLGLFAVLYILTCVCIWYTLDNIYVKERMVKRDVLQFPRDILRVGGNNVTDLTSKRTVVLNSNLIIVKQVLEHQQVGPRPTTERTTLLKSAFKEPSVKQFLQHLHVGPRPAMERTTVLNSTFKEASVKQVLQHQQVRPSPSTERTTVFNSTHNSSNENGSYVIRQQVELPFRKFRYPLDINFTELIINVSNTGTTDVKPINVYPFTYLKSNNSICQATEDIYLLLMIKSAPGNFDYRQAVRETWANKTFYKLDMIRHVFLLARTMNKTIRHRLSVEGEKYNDIVQMTYVDSYYNNTYKTIGGINWCVKYCSQAKFVMMVDDDMYLATDLLLAYLHGLPQDKARSLFAGKVWQDHPQRFKSGKWFMSVKDYPFEMYPPFISAGATIMSMDFVNKLQIAIPFTKQIKFDDVFIAIVAYKLGVTPIHLPDIVIDRHISFADKEFKTMIALHQYKNPNDLRMAWFHHLNVTL